MELGKSRLLRLIFLISNKIYINFSCIVNDVLDIVGGCGNFEGATGTLPSIGTDGYAYREQALNYFK